MDKSFNIVVYKNKKANFKRSKTDLGIIELGDDTTKDFIKVVAGKYSIDKSGELKPNYKYFNDRQIVINKGGCIIFEGTFEELCNKL